MDLCGYLRNKIICKTYMSECCLFHVIYVHKNADLPVK